MKIGKLQKLYEIRAAYIKSIPIMEGDETWRPYAMTLGWHINEVKISLWEVVQVLVDNLEKACQQK